MEDSKAFASEHGLTVQRVNPETENVPTVTCQVLLLYASESNLAFLQSTEWNG